MPVQFFIEKHPVYIYASIYGLNFRAIRAPKTMFRGQNNPASGRPWVGRGTLRFY